MGFMKKILEFEQKHSLFVDIRHDPMGPNYILTFRRNGLKHACIISIFELEKLEEDDDAMLECMIQEFEERYKKASSYLERRKEHYGVK